MARWELDQYLSMVGEHLTVFDKLLKGLMKYFLSLDQDNVKNPFNTWDITLNLEEVYIFSSN